jgi:hypothetical protein
MSGSRLDSLAGRLNTYYARDELDHPLLLLAGMVATFVAVYVGLWLLGSTVVGPAGPWIELGTHLVALLLAGVVTAGLLHGVGVLTRPTT